MKLFNKTSPTQHQLLTLAVRDQDVIGALRQISRGADVKHNHNELLMLAVLNFDMKMTMVLLGAGADLSENNYEALTIARGQDDDEMVEFLEGVKKTQPKLDAPIVYTTKK